MKCQVPKVWKQGVIIPLPKVPKASRPNEFRPISLTPAIAKIAEKLIFEDINGFCSSKATIPIISQHG
jgi:hypothetical protein